MVDSSAEDWVRCAAAEVLGVRFSVSVGDRTATQDGAAQCDLSVKSAAEAWTVRRGCEEVRRFHHLLCGFAQLPEIRGPARVELMMPAWLPTSCVGNGNASVQEDFSSDVDRLHSENSELRQQLQLARELLCERSVGLCSEETKIASFGFGCRLHPHEHAILDARSSDLLRKDATVDAPVASDPSDSRHFDAGGGDRRALTGSLQEVSRARQLAAPSRPHGFVANSTLFIDDGCSSFGDGQPNFAALVDGKVRNAGRPLGNIACALSGDIGSQLPVSAILSETAASRVPHTKHVAPHAIATVEHSAEPSVHPMESSFVDGASSSLARWKSLDELSTGDVSICESDGFTLVSSPVPGSSDHRNSLHMRTSDLAEQAPSVAGSSALSRRGDTHSRISSTQLVPAHEPGEGIDEATSGSEVDYDGVGHLGTEVSDEIADLVVALHSGPKEFRSQAAVDLWHTVSWSERATATVASMPWVFEGMCALVKDTSTTVEDGAKAAFVLGRLAVASSECKVAVASQPGTLESIVDLLRSDVFDAQTNAAGLIWSLLGASEEATANIAATPGMLESLAVVLSSGTVRGKSNAAGAFGNIARRSEQRKAAVRETYGVLEGLVALLACSDSQATVNAAAALWGLMRGSEDSAAAVSATSGAVEGLARLMQSENEEARCNAAGALETLAFFGAVNLS